VGFFVKLSVINAFGEPWNTSCEQWFKDARFKIFCAACWDEAKVVCGGFAES